jgi:glycosyltransferase involved in cell wall biosynthesis
MIIGMASGDYLPAEKSADGIEKWGGAGWARLGQYVEPLRALGHQVAVGILWKQGDCLGIASDDGMAFPDVIILQRIMHDGVAEATRIGQAAGQVVINDVDDWYWGLDPRNMAFRYSHPKFNDEENTKYYMENVKASDLVTVSTPYIAERLKGVGSSPVRIIPNYIDVSRFTPVTQSPLPTFGWVGSTAHRSGDIETLRGIFPRFLDRGDLLLHHSGDRLDAEPFYCQLGVEDKDVSRTPAMPSDQYPSMLTFDVGLVPLRDTPFNHAKSEIKGLEYAASGIPFIAQDLPSYRRLWESWGGGESGFIVAKRPKDWIKGIEKLLDLDTRLEMQSKVLANAPTRDLDYGTAQWSALLEEVTS